MLAHIHAVTLVRFGVERHGAGRDWVPERALYHARRSPDVHVAGEYTDRAGSGSSSLETGERQDAERDAAEDTGPADTGRPGSKAASVLPCAPPRKITVRASSAKTLMPAAVNTSDDRVESSTPG